MIAYNAVFPSADDYLGVIDALHRFGAGVDHGNAELIASVFHADAVVDFSPCGRKIGLDFHVMTGGPAIAGFLSGTALTQTTTHVITNGRVGEGRLRPAGPGQLGFEHRVYRVG